MTPVAVTIREATRAIEARPDHDRNAGILRNVKVLGLASRNGRQYDRDGVRRAAPLFEQAPVYIDHPPGDANARRLHERFGRLTGIHQRADGSLWAKEFRYNPKHPLAESFAWHVANDPSGIGFSLNGDGKGKKLANGDVIVTDITRVHSVDLVDGPATTGGLFEQALPRRILEETTVDPLTDPMSTDTAAEAPVPAPAPTPTVTDPKDAFVTGITALASGVKDGSIAIADAKKQILALLGMIDSAGGASSGTDAGALQESDDDNPDDSEEAKKYLEQLRKSGGKAGQWAAKRLDALTVREHVSRRRQLALDAKLPNIALTEQFISDLADARSDDHARRMIDDRKKLLGVGRPGSAPANPGNKPTDVKALAANYFG